MLMVSAYVVSAWLVRPSPGACKARQGNASTGHRRRGAVCHESVVAIDAAATLPRDPGSDHSGYVRGRWMDGWMPALPLPLCSYLAPTDPDRGSSPAQPSRVYVFPKEMAPQILITAAQCFRHHHTVDLTVIAKSTLASLFA